jgi:hypothetical protein
MIRSSVRTALLTALLLAACTPAPPAQAPQSEPPTTDVDGADPYLTALQSTPVEGQWFFRADEGVSSACFGVPESECQLSFVCEAPSGMVTVIYSHELVPDQLTVLRVFTTSTTIDLDARSMNEGLPSVTARLVDLASAAQTPLIEALTPAQQRFGVEVQGEMTVFTWDESIARALAACRE